MVKFAASFFPPFNQSQQLLNTKLGYKTLSQTVAVFFCYCVLFKCAVIGIFKEDDRVYRIKEEGTAVFYSTMSALSSHV